MDEFKLLVTCGGHYLDLYFKAVAIYFAVTGVLLKLLLDSLPGSTARTAYYVAGILVGVAAIALTLVGGRVYKSLARRSTVVASQLGVPNVYFPATIAVANGFLIVLSALVVAWVCLPLCF